MSQTAERRVKIAFKPQAGPQQLFVTCPFDIVVYGGSRGSGKTYATLGSFWIYAEKYGPEAKGLMIRRSRQDLHDTIETAREMYGNAADWNEQKKLFRFDNGAVLNMAYLEQDSDAMNYQGWSLTRVMVEELTQYASPSGIFKLFATLRSKAGIRCQWQATCNPGGPGHHWVKAWVVDIGPNTPVTDPVTGLKRIFIPALIGDNPALLEKDPGYINRLRASGGPELVRAWLEGDWNVIAGAFFPEFSTAKHVLKPFPVPDYVTKFRSGDWGSAAPYSFGWWFVVQDDMMVDGKRLPRGAIVRYKELYGASAPNVGLKQPAEQVAQLIRQHDGGDMISYSVLDPAAFAVHSGPSIGETLNRAGVYFRPASNNRVSRDGRMGGFDQMRYRLRGNGDGDPMMFFFENCRAIIRTLPMAMHDEKNPEDLADGEDHALDDTRYACLSRPFLAKIVDPNAIDHSKNPYLIRNCFGLDRLQ